MNTIKSQKQANIVLCVILVAAACVVHGVMQGVHDNYGIMMNGLVGTSGISYSYISFGIRAAMTAATVPPTSGIISKRFGAEKMAALYGFALIGHQVGAFASSFLGGVFVNCGAGYAPLWAANLCLASIASGASYMIKEEVKESV